MSGGYVPRPGEAARSISTIFTDTEMINCFSIYHTSWITSGPKSNFISNGKPFCFSWVARRWIVLGLAWVSGFSFLRGGRGSTWQRRAWHKGPTSLTPPHSVTCLSVHFNQSESCLLYRSQAINPVSSLFLMVSENICTFCPEHFHTEYGKCVTTVRCFLKLLTKSFPMFCVKNLSCMYACNYCGVVAWVENCCHSRFRTWQKVC